MLTRLQSSHEQPALKSAELEHSPRTRDRVAKPGEDLHRLAAIALASETHDHAFRRNSRPRKAPSS